VGVSGAVRTARAYADLVVLGIGGVAVLVAAWWLGLRHPASARLDDDIRLAFGAHIDAAALPNRMLGWVSSGPVLLLVFAAAAAALLQRHLRLAMAVPAFAGVSMWAASYLREEKFERAPGTPVVPLTLPSTHTTVALVMAVALVAGLPGIARPAGSLVGGFFAGTVGIGVLARQWQRPSDVLAAAGLVMIVAALALTAGARYSALPKARAAGFDRAVGHPALAVVGAGLAAWRWWAAGLEPLHGSRAHTLFFGSIVVVALAVGLAIGLCAVVADRHILPGSTWWPTRSPRRAGTKEGS
jgi:hypothetical protein